MMFQRACAWSGIACITLFTLAFVIAGFIPPLSPSLSPDEVAAHYRDHATGIRIGAVVMLISSMFYAWFTAVMSGQMRRIPGVHPTVVYAQLAAGALACVTFMLPAMLFVVASFRPERAPELTQILNDLSWIVLIMPWPPFMAQNFAFAFAIFSDKREAPLFPRWLAYLNIWAPIIFSPSVLLPFFKSGPFAWSGIFVIWIPFIAFIAQFGANTAMLLKAIRSEAEPAADSSEAAEPFGIGGTPSPVT
jgi:hypothetical protein